MRPFIILFSICCAGISGASEALWQLSAEQWARPRDGASLVQFQALADAVQAYSQYSHGQLVIHHPGGEEGSLWAHELRSWLVSLGIPSVDIQLHPGSQRDDALDIQVRGVEPL